MTIEQKGRGLWQGAAPTKGNDSDHYITGCSPIDKFFSHLEGVRQVGPSRWIALCPSHGDRTPSLSLKEADDARVLVHCFGGCSVGEIVSSVGLSLGDLFPDKPTDHRVKPERRPWPASDILRCIKNETMTMAFFGVSMLNGQFTEADRKRLVTSISRVQAAATMEGC
jgi:hypothetical protein